MTIVADSNVAAGKTAGASALSCGAPLTSVTWSQVSGPAVTLPASGTPTVAIETTTATSGVIRLKADAVLANGTTASATTDINVGAPVSGSYLTLRVDHSVRPGTATSVRAWPTLTGGEQLSTIAWTQIGGPSVKMNTDDKRLLMFEAPALSAVPVDVALKFRATMTTSGGKTDSDEVIVSIDRQAAAPAEDVALFDRTARVHPYRPGSVYSPVLVRCAYDVSLYYRSPSDNNLCTAKVLPLLQAEGGPIPTIEQIMGRVLVSHDFLGANFENFLRTQDTSQDFRRLLSGVSAIVLGSHVRPSFYTAGTGAIYLDAGNLWLTAEQRDVVTEVPDYRLAFDDELNFTGLSRLVTNNRNARRLYDPEVRETRTQEELVFGLGRLMYHELAHAGDFFSPMDRMLDDTQSIWLNVIKRVNISLPSDVLHNTYKLGSQEMKDLAQVMYWNAPATELQKTYTAAQVGNFFAGDVANDDYAYSLDLKFKQNSREDLAMLFEEFMMAYRHGAQTDVAYVNLIKVPTLARNIPVVWGQRGRIGKADIKPRIKLVLEKIAPWIPAEAAVAALPAPIQMATGISWEAALEVSPLLATPQAVTSMSKPQAASFKAASSASELHRVREDIANRRHAH